MLSLSQDRVLSALKRKRNLEILVEEYNKSEGEVCAALKVTRQDGIVVALCTPLMKRVHTHLQHCGELCFLDTPCTSLSTECRIYFILSHSVAGGLPLGVTIVDKVNEDTLYESFELLKTVLPVSAFGGRNLLGPKVILTSRSQVEQKSLTRAFPLVTAIVCCLHLIQSTWQSVLLKDVKLDRHRARLLQLLKDIVYTDSHGEMCQKMMCLLQDPLVSMYPTFKTYVMNEVFSHHEKWMIVLGKHINLRRTYNKNIFTVSHQVLNDKIMYRCTTFTMPRLFHFFMTRLDNYYKHRLEGIISNKPDMQSYKYKPVSTFVDHDKDMKVILIWKVFDTRYWILIFIF